MKPPVWKRPAPPRRRPAGALSAAQKEAARARAAAAGRRYPNLIDNLWAARHVPTPAAEETGDGDEDEDER